MANNSRARLKESVVFWLACLALNCLLFLPVAWLFRDDPTAPSLLTVLTKEPWAWRHLFIRRDSVDILRLSLEWSLLLALWLNLKPTWRCRSRPLLFVLYPLILSYYLYEAIMIGFFAEMPNSYEDYYLVRNGLAGLLEHFNVPWMTVSGTLLALGLMGWLLRLVSRDIQPQRLTRLSLICLAAGGLIITSLRPAIAASPFAVTSSLALKISENVTRSRESLAGSRAAGAIFAQDVYDYDHISLQAKPTIYLIFVESYGDVLFTDPALNTTVTPLMTDLDRNLATGGWQRATSLSWTPVFGGGSWLAYASLLFGVHINNEALYETLIEGSQQQPLASLNGFLQGQGYQYIRITPLQFERADEQQFLTKLQRFYGYDTWLTLADIPYTGQRFGWGPAPPDQFTLAFLRQYVEAQPGPTLNFFISHNSHTPWGEQPTLKADWRAWQTTPNEVVADQPDFSTENYLVAIQYQLEMVVDFILQEEREDVIFILVGDHQPPRIAPTDGSPYTPIHIISRDAAFIDDFFFFEFSPGLVPAQLDHGIHHEGFFSLFMRAFLGNYSDTPYEELPPYLPLGIQYSSRPDQAQAAQHK